MQPLSPTIHNTLWYQLVHVCLFLPEKVPCIPILVSTSYLSERDSARIHHVVTTERRHLSFVYFTPSSRLRNHLAIQTSHGFFSSIYELVALSPASTDRARVLSISTTISSQFGLFQYQHISTKVKHHNF